MAFVRLLLNSSLSSLSLLRALHGLWYAAAHKKIKTYIDVVVYTIIEYECDKLLLLFTAA